MHRKSPSSRRRPVSRTSRVASGHPSGTLDVQSIRSRFGASRPVFRRISGFSERALANWEAGRQQPSDHAKVRLRELDRLHRGLASILHVEAIPDWLDAPNEAFDGFKPIELIERGETDRLWRMIFELNSGSSL